MIMNLVVIVLVLALGYLWLTRGFFSSFLHLVCVIVAGALAFAFWEPLAYLLLGVLPTAGFFRFVHGMSWGIALIVPFAVATIALRLILDKVIKSNLKLMGPVDMAGAGACGLASAVIAIGILVISMGTMRFPSGFAGYQPVWYDDDRSGSLTHNDTLWLPADSIVQWLYGGMSRRGFSTAHALGDYYPNLRHVGFASRISPNGGKGRNAYQPADFSITGRYLIGDAKSPMSSGDLLADSRSDLPQSYRDIDGQTVSSGYLAGYIIKFQAGAKEEAKRGSGPVVLSNGQVRLLTKDASGKTHDVFPVAAISQASGAEIAYARWRFDAADVFIPSTGGSSTVDMGFEFFVPAGHTPMAIYVKQARAEVAGMPEPKPYASAAERDGLIADGALLRGETAEITIDRSEIVAVDTDASDIKMIKSSSSTKEVMHISLGKRYFKIAEEGTNAIISGTGSYKPSEVGRRNAPTDKKLRLNKFSIGSDQAMVQLEVAGDSPGSLIGPVTRIQPADAPLRLIDTNGTMYDAVGYIYQDNETFEIRYTPADPLTGSGDTPTLSSSRDDQKLTLLFVTTNRVKIDTFAIGEIAILSFDPPVIASSR